MLITGDGRLRDLVQETKMVVPSDPNGLQFNLPGQAAKNDTFTGSLAIPQGFQGP